MPGAVGEEFPAETLLAAVGGVERGDGHDAVALGLGGVHVLVQEERDILLLADVRLLLGVTEFLVQAGGVLRAVGELLDHLADVRVLAAPDQALRPDAHLGAAVAAQHRAVLDQRDLQALARGGDGAAETAVAAADDHEVELAHVLGRGRQPERRLAPGGKRGAVVGRILPEVLREIDRVTAAVETGEVAQRDVELGFGRLDDAAVVPRPGLALGAEGLGEGTAVDDHLEPAGCAGRAPMRDPVLGAHPDAVFAGGRQGGRGGGVLHRLAEAVGQQVGRAHEVDELGVERPTAGILEALRFEQKAVGGRRGQRRGEREG